MNRLTNAVLGGLLAASSAGAGDWPQWGGTNARNMVSPEKGLPASFVPGQKDPQNSGVILETTKNVKWAFRLGTMACSSPAVAGGRVFIGAAAKGQGVLYCLDEATGKPLWQLTAPPRPVPKVVDGRKFWFSIYPSTIGICSSPAVDGDRVYIVTHRCEVACLDVRGQAEGLPDVVWLFDMWEMGVRPSDIPDCSVLVAGDLLYVGTSNGVDRDADASKRDELRKPPAPNAPSLIVLEKKTGRLVAEDDAAIGPGLLHGQWSSPSLGKVGDRTLVFYGGGDGVCYAFEALAAVPEKPVKLKTVWSFDCNPPEYRDFGERDPVTHYCLGDKRRSDTLNRAQDGTFVGMSEIIATPVFHNNRVYVAIGRDPEHGRGKGALYCIDATKAGDITQAGCVWSYKELDRTLSTVSIADGLLYVADVAGRVHCLDADTGRPHWVYEAKATVWGSTLVADGKVYLPSQKYLHVLAAGREVKELARINLGTPMWATPVAANGTLFIASTSYLWAIRPTN